MYENVAQKNITDKWLELISNSLERLEVSILRMKEGCSDLMEFIPMINREDELKRIQYKNVGLVITELSEIVKKVKEVIEAEKFDEIISKLKAVSHVYNSKSNPFQMYVVNLSARTNKSTFTLTPTFKLICNEVSDIHELIISQLRHILWLPGNIKRVEPIKETKKDV